MKNVTKMLFLFLFFCFLIGTVCAVDVDDLKVPFGYSDIEDGVAYLNDGHTELYVGKLSDNPGVFESDISTGYIISPIGNNVYFFHDEGMSMYGLQEKVSIDGVDYIVCVYKDKPLSAADKSLLEDDLKSFNDKNNLEPIAV